MRAETAEFLTPHIERKSVTESPVLGVLDVTPKGAGFIRRPEHSYLPTRGDIHVGRKLIQQFRLRKGDELAGDVGDSAGRGKSRSLRRLTELNRRPTEASAQRPRFNELTAIHPNEHLVLDCELKRLGSGP